MDWKNVYLDIVYKTYISRAYWGNMDAKQIIATNYENSEKRVQQGWDRFRPLFNRSLQSSFNSIRYLADHFKSSFISYKIDGKLGIVHKSIDQMYLDSARWFSPEMKSDVIFSFLDGNINKSAKRYDQHDNPIDMTNDDIARDYEGLDDSFYQYVKGSVNFEGIDRNVFYIGDWYNDRFYLITVVKIDVENGRRERWITNRQDLFQYSLNINNCLIK